MEDADEELQTCSLGRHATPDPDSVLDHAVFDSSTVIIGTSS